MKRRRSKLVRAGKVAAVVGMLIVSTGIAFSLAYMMTKWFYARTGIRWPDFPTQLVNAGLGILIMMTSAVLIGFITGPKQRAIWGEIMDALKRIAKGDFNVMLDREEKFDGQFGDFIRTFNHMAQELKQLEQLRQEFISNVSHEIGSPLTSIRGFAHALRNEELSLEERMHYLFIIETESARLSKLSENLLKLTSLESMHQPFDPRSYRLDTQLRHIILACEPQWLEKGLEVELELEKAEIEADEELLSQVWMNLIVNAIKFTPSGGSLRIGLESTGDRVIVRVTDTGIGISQEDQLRIFERFFKGDKSRTRTAAGSGLGLSIVKKIVELHHGNILVDSQLGSGTTFQVILPLTRRVSN